MIKFLTLGSHKHIVLQDHTVVFWGYAIEGLHCTVWRASSKDSMSSGGSNHGEIISCLC